MKSSHWHVYRKREIFIVSYMTQLISRNNAKSHHAKQQTFGSGNYDSLIHFHAHFSSWSSFPLGEVVEYCN